MFFYHYYKFKFLLLLVYCYGHGTVTVSTFTIAVIKFFIFVNKFELEGKHKRQNLKLSCVYFVLANVDQVCFQPLCCLITITQYNTITGTFHIHTVHVNLVIDDIFTDHY